MMENWREILYPLGFLSSLAFGGRFLLQWLQSEINRKSVVSATFWKLSLAGNLLLFIHSFIQMQYHICVVQSCNAVISWRNLDLMEPSKSKATFQTVIYLLLLAITGTTLAFLLQGYLSNSIIWFRIPETPWSQQPRSITSSWHFIGFIGIILFNSRFWVQWWCAEKYQMSFLGRPFWWLSLIGDLLQLTYFLQIIDPVNIIGPALGLVPYIRNLMLINKTNKSLSPTNKIYE